MDIGKQITAYRNQAGLTIDELARQAKVPVGTLNKIIGGKTLNPGISVMQRIAHTLGRTLADFDDGADQKTAPASEEAMRLASDYDGLDSHGKRIVRVVMDEEKRRIGEEYPVEELPVPSTRVIPLFGNSFAAGRGDPDFGNMLEDYEAPADSGADFAIRINGNSMEPYLPDGSIALGRKRTPKDGDVAALLLDGEFLCKQVCMDIAGNLYLFSLNRDRRDADAVISRDAERSVHCFGTILMDRVPLPTDV